MLRACHFRPVAVVGILRRCCVWPGVQTADCWHQVCEGCCSGCRAATKPQLCCRESADEYLRAQVKITLCKPVEAPGIRGVEATTRASAARLSPSWHCCTSHANTYLISYPRRFGVRTDVDKPVHAAAVPTSLSLPGFRQCRSHCPLLVCQHQHHSALLHRSAQQAGLFVIL